MAWASENSELFLGGKAVPDAWTQVRRYCGFEWDGNPPETWAFRYYDDIPSDRDEVSPLDVVCAGALHPGISKEDMAFFWDHRQRLTEWLSDLPPTDPPSLSDLATADDKVISVLRELPALVEGTSLSLASKVLHRKRPWLIPIVDKEVIDRYRPLTGKRRANEAWPPLLGCLAEDLQANVEYLAELGVVLAMERGTPIRGLSRLRIADIAIWMDAHHRLSTSDFPTQGSPK